MSDEDPFGEDFGSLEDFMKGMKPGASQPLSGILRYRQGADPQDWDQPGQQKYIPGAWQMQAGSIEWTGAAATSGLIEWNFPAPFGNDPLVFAFPTYTWPLFKNLTCMGYLVDRMTLRIFWWCPVALTSAGFTWLAMGPVGP